MRGKGTKQNDKSNMTAEQFRQRETGNAPKGEPMTRDLSGVEYLRQLRGVKTFEEMPLYVQRVYLDVARCFPGVQVWAVGSRVRGEWLDVFAFREIGFSIADSWREYARVLKVRKAAGMKDKKQSDFDFLILDSTAQPVCELPENTERVRVRVPGNEMVAIPIFKQNNTI